ncbi:MAG: hypothetical protein IZT57_05590 [Chloroflexi bacterium]|nr:hypothetical protein [Chloroflexota bacterium]
MKLTREQITELFRSAPEGQDGKKLLGVERRYPKEGESYFSDTYNKWCKAFSNFKCETYPVAIFETIAQPTTLADLVGEDGQNNVWLIAVDGEVAQCHVSMCMGEIHLKRGGLAWRRPSDLEDARWSNDPFTSYEDANEFITK